MSETDTPPNYLLQQRAAIELAKQTQSGLFDKTILAGPTVLFALSATLVKLGAIDPEAKVAIAIAAAFFAISMSITLLSLLTALESLNRNSEILRQAITEPENEEIYNKNLKPSNITGILNWASYVMYVLGLLSLTISIFTQR